MDYKEIEELHQWCSTTMKKILAGDYEDNDPQMLADIIGINSVQNTMFEYIKVLEAKQGK